MDDALPGLVDIEHLDTAGRGFDAQRRQQFLPDLDGAGPPRVPSKWRGPASQRSVPGYGP